MSRHHKKNKIDKLEKNAMTLKLLVDIDENYYNIHFKKGDIVSVKLHTEHQKSKIIVVHGFGAYTYANEGEYEIVPYNKDQKVKNPGRYGC